MKRGILASILAATMILTAASAGVNAATDSAAASPSSSLNSVSSSVSGSPSEAPEITLTTDTTEVITRLADLQIHKTSDLSDALRTASALPDPTSLDYTGATIVISAAEDIPEMKDNTGKILLPAATNGAIVQSIVLTKDDDPTAVKTQVLAVGHRYSVRMTVPPQQKDIALVVPDYTFIAGETDVVRTAKEEIPAEDTESAPVESNSASKSASSKATSSKSASSQEESSQSMTKASLSLRLASPDSTEDLSYWDAQVLSAPTAESTGNAVQQSLNATTAFSYGWNAQSAEEHPADLSNSEDEDLSLYTTNVVLGQDENGRAKITPANTKVASLKANADGTLSAADESADVSLSAGSYYVGLSDTTQYASTGTGSSEGLVLGAVKKNGRTVVMASNMASTSSQNQSTGALQIVNTMEGKSDGEWAGVQFKITGAQSGGGRYDKTFTTDAHGQILVNNLPVGTYTAQPLAGDATEGYLIPKKKTLSVRAGMMATINFQTEKAPASSNVSVPSETSASATPGATVSSSTSSTFPASVPSVPKTGQDAVLPIAATAVLVGAGIACIVICRHRQPEKEEK